MTISAGLRALLRENADVQVLANGRIYPLVTPASDTKTSLPTILFGVADGNDELQGIDAASGTIARTYDINAWAPSYDDADALGEAIRRALHFFQGALTAEGPEVVECSLAGEQDEYDETSGLFVHAMRYRIIATIS